jgi:hypothetical protein
MQINYPLLLAATPLLITFSKANAYPLRQKTTFQSAQALQSHAIGHSGQSLPLLSDLGAAIADSRYHTLNRREANTPESKGSIRLANEHRQRQAKLAKIINGKKTVPAKRFLRKEKRPKSSVHGMSRSNSNEMR